MTHSDVNAFVPTDMKIVEQLRGDLTGEGHDDALLVLSSATNKHQPLGEGSPRTVMLLVQAGDGTLREAASNAHIVPCESCGGLAGDPYAFSRIEPGRFTISISGGSRERWADDFSFHYVPARQDWQLEKVVRELTDTENGNHRKLELSPRDFGQVSFANLDPATLAKPEPLDSTAQ